MFGIEFYPTPEKLVNKMCSKVNWQAVSMILEPSAGKGDMIEGAKSYVKKNETKTGYPGYRGDIDKVLAIEVDPSLQTILSSLDDVTVIDSDFLSYDGLDHFDLIMMNPPFSNGDEHLLKAIDVMFKGQIVCLLNAETIRNPYTNKRKLLERRLDELGADIEYIEDAFVDAEKQTTVEVALIYINIDKDIKDSIFDGVQDDAQEIIIEDIINSDVVSHNDVDRRVEEYNHVKKIGVEFLKNAYKNQKLLSQYISVKVGGKGGDDLSNIGQLQKYVSSFIKNLRRQYWLDLLDSPEINKKLTHKTIDEYHRVLHQKSKMEFSLLNIRTVFANLQNAFSQNIEDAIICIFDELSHQYAWSDECSKNIHYFNGWKTNKSWKVNKKVIMPYFKFFNEIFGRWTVGYDSKIRTLQDIDLVMSYFNGGKKDYVSIKQALESSFQCGQTRNIVSTYFTISVFKKGTIHLTFNDDGILRRFNVFAAKNKNWLPPGYGSKSTSEMTDEEREVVKEFDGGLENYTLLPTNTEMLKLAA